MASRAQASCVGMASGETLNRLKVGPQVCPMPVRIAMQQERGAQCFEGARLVPPEVARKDKIQNRASLGFVVNQPGVLDAITPYASRCLALHGDRHRGWTGSFGDVVSCSAPSLTLALTGEKVSCEFLHPRIFHRR
jgi:hypothetical protein